MVRTGIGWDVHPLVEGAELHLGCLHFPDAEKGLKGHSDADVVCHAICDALLGAAALGDIGDYFPDTDPEFEGCPGSKLLERVRDMVAEKGYRIVNVDCTVMSDAVRLGPKKKDMARTVASHLGLRPDEVCVKATTWEGHGAVGRGEVIACEAIATVRR
ncbi:MAG: 2-C-methyl-D-erythritol 2,4-cyclodiphosphate synthase [Candidatus Latescibacteria bacterium]|nr:2-C-methyl-D-erythritol 2,4-cyclodiphosphate synthase [Candidatus Latescibacterota bacterium]NIM22569.1 2-C-methyl-D-erythritol 2,4-cyclodiphosphate synthase [Candidatus Latescibacterota bacterium]NIM64858.1 2-C-methyl-D-erythritol 2,4-cyclodiphosphate synthase [Candidatus Latescibacterota bacterium]NIO01373.1 2-C-methyl-D-erythritol 2,4-cyclodiphosphate synthase [Candidatus Latescibacterota bacterium]NIO27883.1 2-C-methyl-D-erythritol 2,4-cyclodiphosphate synthase [Candidatus Latescibactero